MTPVGDERRVLCQRCGNETTHVVRWDKPDSGDTGWILWWTEKAVVECLGCQAVTFVESYGTDADVDENGNPIDNAKYYPPRSDRFRELRAHIPARLPEPIESLYSATYAAAISGSFWLAMIGIGSIIEAVGRELGIEKGLLAAKIDRLLEERYVSKDQAEVLHVVRDVRNVAVHEFKAPQADELAAVWEVLNNLIESALILPNMPNRIDGRKKKATSRA